MATTKKTTTKKTTTTKTTATKEPEVKEETKVTPETAVTTDLKGEKVEDPVALEASLNEVASEVLIEKKEEPKKSTSKKVEAPAVKKTELKFTCGKLTGSEILKQIKEGNISITPFDEKKINPNSYNLTLDKIIKTYSPVHRNKLNANDLSMYLDAKKENPFNEYEMTDKGFPLMPGKVYIASTVEETWTDKFIPIIDGRSSIGRLGLMVHLTAGFGDIGFRGKWTLELAVVEPLIIYPGMSICQISFETPCGDTDILYNGKYQNQDGAVTSKLYLD